MATIKGWDTVGATNVGRMADGRFTIAFTGTDDNVARTIFLPAEAVAPLITNLIAVNAATQKDFPQIGDQISNKFLTGVNSTTIASDLAGNQFVLTLTTRDGLDLRFLFDANTFSSLATGLVTSLERHGISVGPAKSQGTEH